MNLFHWARIYKHIEFPLQILFGFHIVITVADVLYVGGVWKVVTFPWLPTQL